MDRLLRDAAGQIDLLTYDSTGALADVDTTNAPTIVVLDSAGVATAAFTPSRTSTGTYKATLPANFEVLDTYQATWNFARRRAHVMPVSALLSGVLMVFAQCGHQLAPSGAAWDG